MRSPTLLYAQRVGELCAQLPALGIAALGGQLQRRGVTLPILERSRKRLAVQHALGQLRLTDRLADFDERSSLFERRQALELVDKAICAAAWAGCLIDLAHDFERCVSLIGFDPVPWVDLALLARGKLQRLPAEDAARPLWQAVMDAPRAAAELRADFDDLAKAAAVYQPLFTEEQAAQINAMFGVEVRHG